MNYANALYSSYKGGIDPEFCKAKCIRHAFKKTGTNPNERKNEYQTVVSSKTFSINPDIESAAIDDEVSEVSIVNNVSSEPKKVVNVTIHDAIEIKDEDL